MNKADSEAMASLLTERGFQIGKNGEILIVSHLIFYGFKIPMEF